MTGGCICPPTPFPEVKTKHKRVASSYSLKLKWKVDILVLPILKCYLMITKISFQIYRKNSTLNSSIPFSLSQQLKQWLQTHILLCKLNSTFQK